MIVILRRLKKRAGWSVSVAVFFLLLQTAVGQVRFRPRLFLGAGLRRALSVEIPDVDVENEYDQLYYDRNLNNPERFFLNTQVGVNLLEFWNVSLGYGFWHHYHEYPTESSNEWMRVDKVYPHSYTYSLHLAVVQWNLEYRFVSSKHVVPYVVGGAGKFFGSAKDFGYVYENDQEDTVEKVTSRADEYDGWGGFVGVGVVLFRYAYVSVEWVDLWQEGLPANGFLDVTLGVTI